MRELWNVVTGFEMEQCSANILASLKITTCYPTRGVSTRYISSKRSYALSIVRSTQVCKQQYHQADSPCVCSSAVSTRCLKHHITKNCEFRRTLRFTRAGLLKHCYMYTSLLLAGTRYESYLCNSCPYKAFSWFYPAFPCVLWCRAITVLIHSF